ncbi:MAG TPA: hypothetical protein IAA19_05815 [Candidatus Olsenella pullistercoris]|uniref:Lipocalin-like domain-containing protein n=1 Tax=Candidatus Olsenella pullistercoris TaxID=2838712 RepID=A0A9D2EZ28_9ACTN|nr:hypothetical protein [Candidatus Olsenella pullistercoris]
MKLRNVIASAVGAFALTVSLVACGGTPAGPNLDELAGEFVGTWELSHAEFDEGPVSEEDYDAVSELGMHVTLDLDDSGDILLDAFGSQYEGTWEIKDESTVTVTLDGESVDMPYADDELTLEYQGETMYFEKVSDEPNMDRDPSENSGSSADSSVDDNLDDLEGVEGGDTSSVETISDLLNEEQILNQQLYASSVDVVEPLDITIWDDDMVLVKITGIGEDFEGDTGYLLSIENRSDTDFVVTNLTTTLDGEDVWYDATFYGPCLAGQSTEAFFYFDADNVGTITSSSNVEFDLGLVDANEDVVGFTSVSMPQ